MKTIVTHISIDLDAVSSIWLIKKYLPNWDNSDIKFVYAGKTLNNMLVDSDPNIIHVDTGLGKFDHHQEHNLTLCASRKVFDYLIKNEYIPQHDIEPLIKIIDFISIIDNFGEINFSNPASDIYDFCLHQTVIGIRSLTKNDKDRCEIMFKNLDATLQVFKNKINAEKKIKEGFTLNSKWGKTLIVESSNEEVVKLAQKLGYDMAITKDREFGFIRIKVKPTNKLDLTSLYEKIKKIDKNADWFFHISKRMLLNGTSKNPNMRPSSLSLEKIIDIIKNI
jgi:hypothetical protein